jgi:hypothetical protein
VSASDVIKHALAGYRAYGVYLFFLTTVFYLVLAVVTLVMGAFLGESAMQVALQIVLMLGCTWAMALVIDAVAAFEEPTADRTLIGRFTAIIPYLTTLSIVAFLYNLLVAIGFMLLIIPGLVFVTWWALVFPVVVLERTGIGESFSRSRTLVRGRGLTVFGTLFMAGVLASVPTFVIFLAVQALVTSPIAVGVIMGVAIGGVVTPFISLCLVTLYADLRSRFATPAARFSASPR